MRGRFGMHDRLRESSNDDHRQRAKFSKYRAQLVAANMVACEGEHTWII
jgi:hypothetical protein